MNATSDPTAGPGELPEHVDVLIVGAGLSGIGAACRLQMQAPGSSYAIVEARGVSGGTWELFTYPGARSDSDMYTLGFPFRPWMRREAIAEGADILRYLRETAAAYGVDKEIRYHRRVTAASWSDADARWTVTIEHTDTGAVSEVSCGFLYLCSGYYRYDEAHTPDWPGQQCYGGLVVHPQHWPADLDVTGKRVLVIGSGATAVTIVPALAQKAAKVTMVQRSPSYILSLPAADPIDGLIRKLLPPAAGYRVVRWKNARMGTFIYNFCQKHPARARAMLRRAAIRQLPAGYDVDTHLRPGYDPWDQRMCLVPDGDFFAAISSGKAEIVTDQIETFTPSGLRLRSGAELDADVIITATGLNLLPLGGIPLTVDGQPVTVSERVTYKGMMLEGVPNMAFAIGYTNASWTLKVDMVSTYVSRIVRHMRENGYASVTPTLPGPVETSPFIEMTSGYFERSRHLLPLQGNAAPWRLRQHYFKDAPLWRARVDEKELRYRRAGALAKAAS
ncbi:MAG TPA: NAD(P)/FAD-dependent oxidoreductase [Streptosporangiaceae bacterium]|nr:NAD(P)/FAD-dependent oxidoreductase [Streptosporangiaceae bacterium]